MGAAVAIKPVAFRFDHEQHVYYVNERQVPNITSMLQKTGHVDPTYYTEAARERGRAVHRLTADYDLADLSLATLRSPFRGYVLAHAAAVKALKPIQVEVEEPDVHPVYRFGGRPDRIWKVFGVLTVVDEKTGGPEEWHGVQLALQAILKAWRYGLKPEALQRWNIYLADSGRFKRKTRDDRRDFDEAYRILKECC